VTGVQTCALPISNAIVAGSAIFGSGDYAAAIARIRDSGLHAKAVAR
jgi:hypothetical protein